MTIIEWLALLCWAIILACGSGVLRLDTYSNKFIIGLPERYQGWLQSLSSFQVAMRKLFLTILTVVILWVVQFLLHYIFEFLLSPFRALL